MPDNTEMSHEELMSRISTLESALENAHAVLQQQTEILEDDPHQALLRLTESNSKEISNVQTVQLGMVSLLCYIMAVLPFCVRSKIVDVVNGSLEIMLFNIATLVVVGIFTYLGTHLIIKFFARF